jgi:hypothetical protein
VSGALGRGEEGGHNEGLTTGEKEGRRPESRRWRRRWSLEVADRVPSGCRAKVSEEKGANQEALVGFYRARRWRAGATAGHWSSMAMGGGRS